MTDSRTDREILLDIEALLKSGSVPTPGEDPTVQPAFSTGTKGTRRVQLKESTRLRLPKTGLTGKILYTSGGGLKIYKPTTTKKNITTKTILNNLFRTFFI